MQKNESENLEIGKSNKGIKIKNLSPAIAFATAIISVFLLVGIYLSYKNYEKVLNVSHEYIEWQQTAQKMRETSDYLTEKVRDFAETGERLYLYSYFHEAESDQNRDKALAYIKLYFPDSTLYSSLENAMNGSLELMETEYYSMRLKIESMDLNVSDFPKKIQDVVLKEQDDALTPAEKDQLARALLFNNDYINEKEKIANNTQDCINQLVTELKTRQSDAEFKMRFAFIFEVIMILIFIAYSIFMIFVTSKQVFRPIMRSIPQIKNDDLMPIAGAYELRELAKTYNYMYTAHHKEKISLKFKSEHDALTGALNRRALDNLQVAADDGKLAFLIVDVDNFKMINDANGHLVGDEVLKKVVELMRSYLRSDDKIFRLGGDEFAIVMFGIDEKAKHIIQQKFDKINDELAKENDGLPPVSLSVGVAFGNVIDQQLVNKADNAVYLRKQTGKSGVSFHEENY